MNTQQKQNAIVADITPSSTLTRSVLRDYFQLMKMRLTLLVVFSSVVTYLTALDAIHVFSWTEVIALSLGGFLVTAAANGINQIIEKDFDILMVRTANRPVATNRISSLHAALFSGFIGIAGVVIIAFYLNQISSLLALISLLIYAFIYTPLKRITPLSVLVGAIPGAIPAMLGWVACTGKIDMLAIVFFGIQFFWQFPHFWSVAWILDDDYKRAGFKMLPSEAGRDKITALQTFAFTSILIPLGLLPLYLGFSGVVSGSIATIGAIWMCYNAYRLFKTCALAEAKKLMMSAFMYLPIVQLAYFFDKF